MSVVFVCRPFALSLSLRCEHFRVESHSSRFAHHRKLTPFLSRNHALGSGNAGLSGRSRQFGLSGLSCASGRERTDKRDCANLNEQRMAGHVRRLTELRIALRGVTAFPFLSSSNGFGKVCGRGSEEEERTDQ